jgi:hypothetical protein
MPTPDDDDFAMFEADLGEVVVSGVEVFSDLNTPDLIQRHSEVECDLAEIMEMHFPRTDRGRELHSKRDAIRRVLRERGIL